ncbi:MAG: hypothetical protein ACRECO_07080 [Xanthobacteraceae bacterium]
MRMSISGRLILPGAGVLVFLLAYFAQNVWHLFHVDDITRVLRGLDRSGLLLGMFVLGAIEGTVLLCFYVPGTAVVIVLLLALQTSVTEALPLLSALMAGTAAGYGASFLLGRFLQWRLPALVGEAHFRKVQGFIERYGLLAFLPGAAHPNQLALGFAVLGYFRPGGLWRYFAVAIAAQAAWWTLYVFGADLLAGQDLVTSSNFQLYVAAVFFAWFIYELFSGPHPANVP